MNLSHSSNDTETLHIRQLLQARATYFAIHHYSPCFNVRSYLVELDWAESPVSKKGSDQMRQSLIGKTHLLLDFLDFLRSQYFSKHEK